MNVRMVLAIVALCMTACASTPVQHPIVPAPADPLTKEIEQLDAQMFARYNAHDLDGLMSFFAEDLEFYHDKDGLISYANVANGFRNLFARNDGLSRQLVPGTLKVYPIGNYGALETGAHRFCHIENGKEDCGTFQFANIWRRSDSGWKISRLLSYGH
jgi:ketosteroid isomerase-like protein